MAINILIVEDSRTQLELLQHLLTTNSCLNRIGTLVTIAENGRVACERVAQAQAAGFPFNLILMDMQMPILDGYQAMAQLRTNGFTAPIIALTAHATAEDREKCCAAGCTDYLSKLLPGNILLTTVLGHLKILKSSEIHADSAAVAGAHDGLQSQCKDDPDLRYFLPAFVASLPEQVARLMKLLDDGNIEELKKNIHNLKGTAGVYGFGIISESATQAEMRSHRTDITKDFAAQVQTLVELIRCVEGYDAQKERAAVSKNI